MPSMSDIRPRNMTAMKSRRIADLAAEVLSFIRQRRDGGAIQRMRAELAAKETLIREQAAELAHSRKIFNRSSAAAGSGFGNAACQMRHCGGLMWSTTSLTSRAVPLSIGQISCDTIRKLLERAPNAKKQGA